MNPAALRNLNFTIAGLSASQSVNVHPTEFYVITCFGIPTDKGTRFVSSGSKLPFSEAVKLEDNAWREQLAREHLAALAEESRQIVTELDTRMDALRAADRDDIREALLVEGLDQLERAAGPLT